LTNARGSSAHLVPLKITNEVVTLRYRLWSIHRVSKNKQNYFCYNYVKLPPNLTFLAQRWQTV